MYVATTSEFISTHPARVCVEPVHIHWVHFRSPYLQAEISNVDLPSYSDPDRVSRCGGAAP